MPKEKGLTGCKELIRGFVGGRASIKYGQTMFGKAFVKFDLSFGENNPEKNKYPTWRHCAGYGDVVDKVKGLEPGTYIRVAGWPVTEAVMDEYRKPVMVDGRLRLVESLVLIDAEIMDLGAVKQARQLSLGVDSGKNSEPK